MSTQVKRRVLYIDAAVQNRLLVAFVMLEVLLVGVGMIVLFLEMKEVIEENLFHGHFAARESLSKLLFRESIQALAVLFLVNLAALGLAEWMWWRYLHASILRPLSNLLARTGDLDFTPDENLEQQHAVLALAVAWRKVERERNHRIRAELSRLDVNADYSSTSALEQTRATLENLKACLPSQISGSRAR